MASSRQRPQSLPAAIGLAVLSAGALSLAHRPVDWRWLIFVALAPMLWAILTAPSRRRAFAVGAITGTVYGLFAIHPLLSALDWTGWAVVSGEELRAMRARQWWFLHGMWLLLAFWGGGFFWGVYGAALRWWSSAGPWTVVAVAPALWIVENEWLRGFTTWGFHWAFLGNSVAPFAHLRQSAVLGGVWLLSLLVVTINLGLVGIFLARRERAWRGPAVAALLLFAAAWVFGLWHRGVAASGEAPLRAVAVQHHKERYDFNDFARIGVDRSYLLALERAMRLDPDLVVLPETISFGSLTVDGSSSEAYPEKPTAAADSWTDILRRILRDRETQLALGVEIVERGRNYNSIGYWDRQGLRGWYHKRKLVPFGEYQPGLFRRFGQRGRSQFAAGDEPRIVEGGAFRFGGFVCQEVLYPTMVRRSVAAGANLLVTGGNDGVFSDPRIAALHAELAQLRAVESGRYVVRAMKTGVTAILDPAGHELARTVSDEAALLAAEVGVRDRRTPFVRLGPWPLPAAALVLIVGLWRRLRHAPSPSHPNPHRPT